MQEQVKNRVLELLKNGTVNRVLAYEKGLFDYDVTPKVFTTEEEINEKFVFNEYCSANLSKYLVKESKLDGKIAVVMKPCDTYSFNQLMAEHKIERDKVYVIGAKLEKTVDAEGNILQRCKDCKSKKFVSFDEIIGEDGEKIESGRFDLVEKLENMTADERYEFWRNELSRCIRCNACRNVCPACTCEKCIFDNPATGVDNKAPASSFEENMFHIIRAFHVAGRCTDCGECSRVCPEHIPLHLLNRKFIKDINELYGEYQAGESTNERNPLINYTKEDVEPSIVKERGNK